MNARLSRLLSNSTLHVLLVVIAVAWLVPRGLCEVITEPDGGQVIVMTEAT